MTTLRRIPIKYIRDYIKKDYKLRDECYICKCKDNLELHHMYSISQLFENWCNKNNIREVASVDHIKEIRIKFYEDEFTRLNNDNLYKNIQLSKYFFKYILFILISIIINLSINYNLIKIIINVFLV
jgi:hypothetical protein